MNRLSVSRCLLKIVADRPVDGFISPTSWEKYSSERNCYLLIYSCLKLVIPKALMFVQCDSADVS